MTERTKTIKGLISGQVDMGTFGLVELELLAIENEMEALRKHAVSGSLPSAEEMATIRLEKERGKNIELWVDGEQTEYWKEIYAMGVNDERSRAGNDR